MSAVTGMESFDMYNGTGTQTGLQAKWTGIVDLTKISLVAGRFGGQALRMINDAGTSTPAAYRLFPSSTGASFSAGFAIRLSNFNSTVAASYAVYLGDSSVAHLAIGFTATGAIRLMRGTTLLATSALDWLAASSWGYIEIEAFLDDTTGTANVYVDGNLALTFAGDTRNGGTATINRVGMSTNYPGSTAPNAGVNMDLDDVYINDSITRLGGSKIEVLRPSADVSVQWTPNSGANNYSRVNETLVDGDTTYVEAGTIGFQDLYDIPSLSSSPAIIHAVQVSSFPRKTDAGDRAINHTVKSGATTSQGSDFYLSSSYSKYERILNTDPNTGLAWDNAAINALQIGPRISV